MNYTDYYERQAGGAIPYFVGARHQRGHGLGSLFGSLLRSVMPLVKRGAVALGKRALSTGAHIADDVLSGQNIRTAAKRRVTTAGRDMMSDLLTPGVRPRKRIRRTPPAKRVSTPARRRRKQQKPKVRREPDIFDDGVRS